MSRPCRFRTPLAVFLTATFLSTATFQSTVLAQNPTFTDETSSRLTASPATGAADPSEKDFAVGDLDNDGDDDVIVARRIGLNGNNGQPLPNTLLMNEGGVLTDLTSSLAPDLLASARSRDVVIADFDADGWVDVLIANGPNTLPQLLMNQGDSGTGIWMGLSEDSSFLPSPFNVDAWSVAAGDLANDSDAFPDLFIGVFTGNDRILVNLGDSGAGWLGFADESTRLGANASTFAVRSATIADLNDDGDLDIIEGVTGSGSLRMLPNNGSGQFSGTPQTFASSATYNHGLGDLDDDGALDVFAVQNGTDVYRRNLGPGAGETVQLGAPTSAAGTNGFGAICRVGDLDGNSFDDFLVCDLDQEFPQDCSRRLRFFYSSGVGPNYLSPGYPAGAAWTPAGTSDVALVDLDADGDLDLLIGHCDGLSVFTQDGGAITFVRGDVNDDTVLDISDPVALLSFLFVGGSLDCQKAGDVNDDGGNDIADSISLLNHIFLGAAAPPAPMTCGVDPTADGLTCDSFTSCP